MDFTTKVRVKEIPGDEITGLQDWIWPIEDEGAWEGPHENWIKEHSQKVFKYIEKYDVAVQAGGCCGMYPRLLAQKFSWVYTFEPNPVSFYCLANNCKVPNIVKIQAALGETIGMVCNTETNSVNVGQNKAKTVDRPEIPRLTIDTFKFHSCDLIMLDTESAELEILKGAVDTLTKFHPVIVAESLGTQAETGTFLSNLGYRMIESCASDQIFIFNK